MEKKTALIKPHGGILINRILGRNEAKRLKTKGLLRIRVMDDFILDVEKIAIGAYSPLKGFMCRDDFASVVERMKTADGTIWTIPIYLPLDQGLARNICKGEDIIICNNDGMDIALLKVKDVFSFPKAIWAKKVYATDSRKHPGVNRIYSMHDKLIGGDIYLINRPSFKFEEFNLDPVETRAVIKEKGWKTIAGFQTRNVPHRAHEYLQKLALSFVDGILIHPIIGWKKESDFNPDIIIQAYEALIRLYFPKERVIFAGLAAAMRYAGPREAVFHAIIRKNYGCTHFIVGRDHAGIGDYYDKYDAHRIFDNLPGLGVIPLLMRGPYYCLKCREVVSDKICPHSEKWHSHISGTLVRQLILKNSHIPEYLMRPEIVKVVMQHKTSGGALFI